MRADIHDGPEQMLQSKAGYIDARPLTANPTNLLATHGRTIHSGHPRRAYFTFCICRPRNCSPLARIELAGCSFGSVLWARIECDFRARCCLMYGVDHHLE